MKINGLKKFSRFNNLEFKIRLFQGKESSFRYLLITDSISEVTFLYKLLATSGCPLER